MIKIHLKKLFITFISITLLFSCSKEDEISKDIQVNDFIWGGMNAYYKWQGKVPDLSDKRFSSRHQLNDYLGIYEKPKNLFNSLLYKKDEIDKFSWIVDDYIALENSFEGKRLTSGLKVDLINENSNYYAYVYDVVKNSEADKKGLKRGMIITEVDNTKLTKENIGKLFSNNSFTIHLADYNNGNPVSNGQKFELTKTNVQENPIKISKIINKGNKKIGYLLYNQFASSYDKQLNTEFGKFKTAGITDLIIDLRYNGGGSVKSAVYLGSMITGQFNNQLFSKQIWNEKVMSSINNDLFINKFTNKIGNETINSLNLKTVYFIVSKNTASASELVINALKPYITVKLIGEQTYGKHVGSITLYDSDDYTKKGENFNTSHHWAMQLITFEIKNKNNENKPEGFSPDEKLSENPKNLGILGEDNEPLLSKTIEVITGKTRARTKTFSSKTTHSLWNSNMLYPNCNNMYIKLPFKK
ncbi:MAG: peptidase S41 [Tenacibaculum sp.]|nr:peptidase S41 [Tenacibaculum sp.]